MTTIFRMSHRVVVTGLGTVSPFGVGVKQLWTQIKANQSALKLNEKLGVLVGSIPRGEGPTDFNVNEFSTREQRQMSAASLLTLKAVEEALKDSGLEEVEQGFHDETGVNIGKTNYILLQYDRINNVFFRHGYF